jgi:DNA-binding transcriptional LysR family regulator
MKESIRNNRIIIDSLRSMAVFVKVAEAGSFKKAAKALALSPSVVSHHIAQLESRLEKPLLYRNTRNLALTDDGRVFLDSAIEMLRSANDGFDKLSLRAKTISGDLKIALPTALSRDRFLAAIADFEQEYSNITLSLSFTDRINNVIEDGFDAILKFGESPDLGLGKKKLTQANRLIVCSSQYFDTHAKITSPSDLLNAQWIWLNNIDSNIVLDNNDPNIPSEAISVGPRMFVDNILAVRRLVMTNIGISIVPDFVISEDIESGKVIRILPDWNIRPVNLYAIWPQTATRATLTHIFLDFMEARLSDA